MKYHLPLSALAAALITTTAAAQEVSYAIDPMHTFATFEVSHFGTSTNRGRFDKKAGMIHVDWASKTGRVEVSLETASISTGIPAFDKHLQSEAFFNSAAFPTATFTSDKFSFSGEKLTSVSGTLTLLGKSNPIVLKATNFNCYISPMLKVEVCGGDFETTINRSQWGMDWGLNMGMPNGVKVLIQVEAVKQ